MASFTAQLHAGVRERVASEGIRSIALVGRTAAALELFNLLRDDGLGDAVHGPYDLGAPNGVHPPALPWGELRDVDPDLVVICADAEKEQLLRSTAALFEGCSNLPDVVIAGMAHLEFQDPVYTELDAPSLVPSYATGHEHSRIHMYQALSAAANRRLSGAVVEFGSFKGGTIAWLARVVTRLGLKDSPVIGFDTWDGFPARESLLDLYTHPRCVFTDVDAVRRYVEPLGVELIVGDIRNTAPPRLQEQDVLLAFVDTDNYSGTRRALEVVASRLVAGGTIVLDHFSTATEYLYTIGERMAAKEALSNAGLLQIHGTGVFVKLPQGQLTDGSRSSQRLDQE